MEQLTKKKCVPCEGKGVKAYSLVEVKSRLAEIPGWNLSQDSNSIERCFTLKNFVACTNLINKIKDIAEDEMHHPDLHLTGYKNLRVVLYTHAVGGITENDLIVAANNKQLSSS